MSECLDTKTAENIMKWGSVVLDPMSIITNIANL